MVNLEDKQTFINVVLKANEKGYLFPFQKYGKGITAEEIFDQLMTNDDGDFTNTAMRGFLLDHSFAKAFFGEEVTMGYGNNEWLVWQDHLRAMVVEKNMLTYLERFI